MFDTKQHIVKKSEDVKLNDWIRYLLQSQAIGRTITCMDGTSNAIAIDEDHVWNFENYIYQVIAPREYIIHIDKDGEASIIATTNQWTRSDFGKNSDGSEHILMREVDLTKE